MTDMLILALVGLLSGICASLGIGGGFVLLLYLTAVSGMEQREAQLLNLLFFLPVAVLSLIFHRKNGLVAWSTVRPAVAGGLFGVLIGVWAASALTSQWLAKCFAVFILCVGLRECLSKSKKPSRYADTGPRVKRD